MKSPKPPLPESELLSVVETRAVLGGISHSCFYAMVRRGQLDVVRLAGRTFVHKDVAQRLAREGTE